MRPAAPPAIGPASIPTTVAPASSAAPTAASPEPPSPTTHRSALRPRRRATAGSPRRSGRPTRASRRSSWAGILRARGSGGPGGQHTRIEREHRAGQRLGGELRRGQPVPRGRHVERPQVRAAERGTRGVGDRERDDGVERARRCGNDARPRRRTAQTQTPPSASTARPSGSPSAGSIAANGRRPAMVPEPPSKSSTSIRCVVLSMKYIRVAVRAPADAVGERGAGNGDGEAPVGVQAIERRLPSARGCATSCRPTDGPAGRRGSR